MRLAVAGLVVVAGALLFAWQAGHRADSTAPASASGDQRAGVPLPAAPAGPRFDADRAFTNLTDMVAIGPRPSGSPGIRRTRAYITRQLSDAGLTVQEQPFVAHTPRGPVEMMNLVVRLPGRRADRILVTGHYDTKLFPSTQVFVGASDGGSSAAFLIELARVLHAGPAREFTYELVWFDGEEAVVEWSGTDHTYGSQYYVDAAGRAGALAPIKAMILVDMIGDRNLQIRRENKSTRWLVDLIWAAAQRTGHGNTFLDAATDIEDDHVPFLAAGVPAVDLIDLDYPQWHNEAACCDDLEHVAAKSLQIVGEVLLAAFPDIERFLLR